MPRKLPFKFFEVIMERNLFAVINNIRLSKEGQSILKRMGNIGLPVCHVDNDEWLFIVPGSVSYTHLTLPTIVLV